MGRGVEVYQLLSKEGHYTIACVLAIGCVGVLASLWLVDGFERSRWAGAS